MGAVLEAEAYALPATDQVEEAVYVALAMLDAGRRYGSEQACEEVAAG